MSTHRQLALDIPLPRPVRVWASYPDQYPAFARALNRFSIFLIERKPVDCEGHWEIYDAFGHKPIADSLAHHNNRQTDETGFTWRVRRIIR